MSFRDKLKQHPRYEVFRRYRHPSEQEITKRTTYPIKILPEIVCYLRDLDSPTEPIFLGEQYLGTITQGFLTYLTILPLPLTESNLAKIVEAFHYMHGIEKIIQGIKDLSELDKIYLRIFRKKQFKLKQYESVIQLPKFQEVEGGGGQIVFWSGDMYFGHLKRWVIFADEAGLPQIETEIVEEFFFKAGVSPLKVGDVITEFPEDW